MLWMWRSSGDVPPDILLAVHSDHKCARVVYERRGVSNDARAASRTVLVLSLPGHRQALHDLHRVAGEEGEVRVLLEHLCRGLV
jgi:hypothetical protein